MRTVLQGFAVPPRGVIGTIPVPMLTRALSRASLLPHRGPALAFRTLSTAVDLVSRAWPPRSPSLPPPPTVLMLSLTLWRLVAPRCSSRPCVFVIASVQCLSQGICGRISRGGGVCVVRDICMAVRLWVVLRKGLHGLVFFLWFLFIVAHT